MFFISNAYAQAPADALGFGGNLTSFLPLVLMFVVMYFLMIRPQMKRAKEHKNLLGNLQKGDEVVTSGGIAGKVTKVADDFVTIAIAENVEAQFQKAAIAVVLPKGTLKNL